MPDVRESYVVDDGKPRPAMINISDLHLTLRAPVSRGDGDWLTAMKRPLDQVKARAKELGVPVVCNGDIFDKYNPPPELINFAIRELPRMYAIPGQHDLPFHRYNDIDRSAYWTLVEAGVIIDLKPGKPEHVNNDITLWGFPWGFDTLLATYFDQPLTGINVAVIHSYIWKRGKSYPGAPVEKHISQWKQVLKDFKVACFGDNHLGFLVPDENVTILNCGAMMRRKSDEAEYWPSYGVVWSNGQVTREPFDISKDVLLDRETAVERASKRAGGFDEFMESLRSLGDTAIDFHEAVLAEMMRRKASDELRAMAMRAMEK